MSEKLINVSTILLFGRVVEDVELKQTSGRKEKGGDAAAMAHRSANHLLQREMEADDAGSKPNFARIYAFSYEGHYYDLAKPALFLVHGPGSKVTPATEHTGLPADTQDFAPDIKVWAYDKSDLSIRLDPESGTFEQILLQAEQSAERVRVQYSGQGVRFAGQGVRFAGQGVRFAGQGARLRGGSGNDD